MEMLDKIISLSNEVTHLRARREDIAGQLAHVDARLAEIISEMSKYIPNLMGTKEGNGAGLVGGEVRTYVRGYKQGSVAHRILVALAHAGSSGMTGAELTVSTGVENKQIHSMLSSRLVPAGHVEKQRISEADETLRGSRYVITDAGQTALSNVKEGGSDEVESTAEND